MKEMIVCVHRLLRLHIVQVTALLKGIYRIDAISTKISMTPATEIEKPTLKFIQNCKESLTVKQNWERNSQRTPTYLKSYCKASVSKQCDWRKDRHMVQ